ncbi:MAG TPA: PASTA domain-containing protein [Flavobacterium sp.]|nr:PASTA domain-containing protein [Flavobacterium sp.]
MTFRQYLGTRDFLVRFVSALLIIIVLVFLCMYWLTFLTRHGDEIAVPDLRKMSEEQVAEKLDDLGLEYVLLDTVDFEKGYPKYSVVLQDPIAGAKVKEGRKIYIKINSAGFTTLRMPDLIEKTYRQAVPTLIALGLEEGKITYKPYLGKDMVLEMWSDGKKLKAGDKISKASKIDLVLGDGKIGFEEADPADSLSAPTDEIELSEEDVDE